eukprot:scaffold294_cov221-Amphora_coffeaeformis.AAC.67
MGDNGEEKQQMDGVTEVQDSDVLCGRGGAALRHPGNQTYRKLVSLNKGLYITCLKTEKLKISRSIVAAIREKKGRFLEKDAASGTWYDIGDKKAVEKTSQALREGQPKLRQQIVELGGGAVGAASLIESQFGAQAVAAVTGAGLYPSTGMQQGGAQMMTPQQQQMMANGNMQQQMMNQQGYAAMQQRQMQQQQMGAGPFDDIQNDLMTRLSLHDDNNHNGMQQQGSIRPSMQMRQQQHLVNNSNGMDPQISLNMSDYHRGGYGGGSQQGHAMNSMGVVDDGGGGNGSAGGGMPMDNSFRTALRGMASPPSSVGGSMHSQLDFSSMHSIQDYIGMSNHSMGAPSNHSMGPPSSHLPTLSSISRQQQIDERYPQNIGLGDHHTSIGGMSQAPQSFRRQLQDNGPPQPIPPEQHPAGRMQQQHGMVQQQQQKIHPGQPSLRGYGAGGTDLEPMSAFPERSRSGYPDDQRPRQQIPGGYPQDQGRQQMQVGSRIYNDNNNGGQQHSRNMQGYDQPRRTQRTLEDQRVMAPPDRNISSSTDGASSRGGGGGGGANQSMLSLNQSMASVASSSTQPSVLRAEARQKMDRRNIFARMKFSRPPSVRDAKMGLGGASTHSTGDGMPDIHMVESQLSLHSTLSNMTDGNSAHQNKMPNNSAKGPWVETAKVVDHSNRSAEYVDIIAPGSKHSLMSGLSKISDHSLNDASIFSSLSKQIGNVSTRSIAMSEISVIDVAERDGEDEPSSNHEGTESHE